LGLVLRSAGSLLVLCGLTAGLYRLGVPTSARIHVGLLPGTLAVVFLIGVLGFGYRTYLATLGDGSVYQAGLSVVVVTLTALFLFSLAMLLGLAINQQIARRIKHETGPVGLPRSDRSDPGAELQPLGVEKTTDSQIPGPAPEPTQNQSAQLDGDARRGAAADLRCDVYSSPEKALRFSALFAVAIILFIAHPMGIGVLLGTLTAFSLSPFYLRLVTRWERPVLAALFCVGLTILGGAAVFAGFGYLLIGRGIGLLRGLAAGLSPGGAVRNFFESINARLPLFGVHPGTLAQHIGNAAAEISERLADIASRVAGAAFSGLLALFFLFITAYFVLQNWSSLTRRAEIMLPLKPRDTRALFDEFRRVGRSVLLGTVLTGMAQGLLAFIGYYLTRIPEAAFFGALTAVVSLVPGVGTLLVWVPLGVYLLITGHVVLGVIELLYGAFVVGGLCDYVLRPRLVGGHGDMPALLTFLALFGALKVFGLIGLILGPVIMSLAVALLRIYEREATLRRAAEVSAISTDCLDPL
jgi:predicted PurR-regulated permease PerM